MKTETWILTGLWIILPIYVVLSSVMYTFFPLGLLMLIGHIFLTIMYLMRKNKLYMKIALGIFIVFLFIQFVNFPQCGKSYGKGGELGFECNCIGLKKYTSLFSPKPWGDSQCLGFKSSCQIVGPCYYHERCDAYRTVDCDHMMDEYESAVRGSTDNSLLLR